MPPFQPSLHPPPCFFDSNVLSASFTSGRLAPRTATVRAAGGKVEVVRWTWGVLRAFLAEPENARAKVGQSCHVRVMS